MTGRNLLATGEETARIVLHDGVVLLADESLADDLLAGDVHVVALVGLGRRGDDGLGEALVLAHSLGQLDATELAASCLVLTPGRSREDATDDHLHTEALTLQAHRHHRVGGGQFPVGADVARLVEHLGCNLVQHLTFEGNTLGQHHVEGRDAVGGDHHHQVVVDVIHIAYFAVVHAFLSIEMEISRCQCFHR